MQILSIISLLSFLGAASMIARKYWHLKRGNLKETDSLHLIAPLAKAAHTFATKMYLQIHTKLEPSISQLWSELMIIGYNATAALAKRFAKIANEIKGKGVLPEAHETSFLFTYLKNQE